MNTKILKKSFLTIGSLMLLTIVITMSLSAYVAWQLTHPDRLPVSEFPEAYDLPYMEVQFMSRVDSVRLEGWLIPADTTTDKIVIQAHGYMDNRSNISAALPVAKGLHKTGIAVLMFDFRGHGNSSGELVSGGLYEVRDLLGAVDYARTHKFNQIGLFGFSMGGATTVMAAGRDTMITAVAVDGAFTSQFFNEHLHTKTQLPSFPFTPQIHWIADKMYDIDFTKIAPEKTLEDWNPRPTFLIAGEKDQIVPVEDTRILYQKINNDPKVEFWEIPEGRHIRSYDIQPEKYQKKVVGFFQEHL